MILTSFNVEVPLLLVIVFQFVFFALFLIAFLVTLMTKNFITSRDELIKKNVYQIRSLTSDVDIAIEMSDDRELKDLLKTLTEDIRYSDPMSIKEIESIEEEIKDRVTQIQSYVRQGNKDQVIALVKETKLMLKQRNSIIANKKS